MPDANTARFRAAAWARLGRPRAEAGVGGPAAPAQAQQPPDKPRLKPLLEALLFASPEPLAPRELARAARSRRALVEQALAELAADYAGRGFQLHAVAGGYVFRTNPELAAEVRRFAAQRPVRMTRAQLETLAIVAYRQPITRPEIDDVRGVDSGPVLRTLLERELVRIIGKKEEPGRPLLYGTADKFLELFGLAALTDLPTLREFTELSPESREIYERELGVLAPEGAIEVEEEGQGESVAPAPERER